jgi:cytochrome d ubiquinol oxidase subunit II
MNSISDPDLYYRSVRKLLLNSLPFLVFFLFFVISLLLSSGFAADPSTGTITIEKYKYFHNFLEMPLVLVLFLLGVFGVLYGIGISIFIKSMRGIWFSGAGTVLAVFSLFLTAGFNGTSFYPSSSDLQSSLTIQNSSSSYFTLKTMTYVSFIIPLVLAYIWYAWKAINDRKITPEEMMTEEHKY